MKSRALSKASVPVCQRKIKKRPFFYPQVLECSECKVHGYNVSVSKVGNLAIGNGNRMSQIPLTIDKQLAFHVRTGDAEAINSLAELLVQRGYIQV